MNTEGKKYVAYYRVSTKQQGRSGLGLEAQKSMVATLNLSIKKEFTEIESGKKNNRPLLKQAIDYCKKNKCVLAIAKLDRLSRNAAFILALRESGIEFLCADMPEMNTLTVGIFATLAQYERELIADRTKKSLAEKKKQGFKLGSPKNLTDFSRKQSAKSRKKNAKNKDQNQSAIKIIAELKKQHAGITLRTLAENLNKFGLRTAQNKQFTACTVQRLLKLYAA